MNDFINYSRPYLAVAFSKSQDLLIMVQFTKEDLILNINLSEIERNIKNNIIHREVYLPAYYNALTNPGKNKKTHPLVSVITELDDHEPLAISALFSDEKENQQKLLRQIGIIEVFNRANAANPEGVYNFTKQWLKETHSIVIPDFIDNPQKKEIAPTQKRLKLTPNEREKLNDKVVTEVLEFKDSGKGTLPEAFLYYSINSVEYFGVELSAKAIEGRYSRNKKRFNR